MSAMDRTRRAADDSLAESLNAILAESSGSGASCRLLKCDKNSLSSGTSPVRYEAEGGIRNPACQDEDSTDSKPRLDQEKRSEDTPPQERIHPRSHRQQFRKIMTVCYTRVPWNLSPNFVVGVSVSVLMFIALFGCVPNQTIGFYCNDPKISHKFTGDTITTGLLLGITIFLPGLVIWAVEWAYYSPDSYKCLDSGRSSSRTRSFWSWYGYYTVGWYFLVFCVEILKLIVGEPRPHFFDSCKPKEMENCTTGEYIQSFTCTNTELSRFYVYDSDKSFPSGHAAMSMFTATFITWYLQNRMPNRLVLVMVKPWLQCTAILWGLGCGMTRVIDHRHHFWDVGCGYILGLLFGVFVVRVLCRSFRPTRGKSNLSMIQPNGALASGAISTPKDYANKKSSGNHQSVKKLLSTSSSIETQDDRELGDMPPGWSNA